MPTLDINGTQLYYEDTGPGSTGETIVFSHGLLWNTEMFAPQIAALRSRYRCIAWDHRGQGQSAADRRECIDMELVWQDATLLVERLVAGPVHFCGLSMGGFVAMRMGARRPDLVTSLLLLETSADPEPEENVGKYRTLSRLSRIFGMKLIAKQVAPIMLGKSVLADRARKAEVANFVSIMARRRDIWRAVNGVIDRAGCYDECARIAVPTLIVVGEEDVATTPAKAQRLVSVIPGAQLVTIPNAGHSSSVEAPAAVTAAIETFLASLAARSR